MTYCINEKMRLLKDQLALRRQPWSSGPEPCHESPLVLASRAPSVPAFPIFSVSPPRVASAGCRRRGLEARLSNLPTTSPAMKTQHTAQAAHSCLCACSLSGVRPGCGSGSLWQWWKGISPGLDSSGTGSDGSVKRLRRATQFSCGAAPGLPCSSLPRPGSRRRALSGSARLSFLHEAWSSPGPCGRRAT